MKQFDVTNHEPSFLPEGEWNLIWSDEFDGTELDTTKWDYRLSMMNKRHPAWVDRGVHLDGESNVVFTLIEEDGRPVSAQLQTGYNFMDEPVVRTKFGNDDLQWNIGKLHENKFTHAYVTTNAAAASSRSRTAGGAHSGSSRRLSARRSILPTPVWKSTLWNASAPARWPDTMCLPAVTGWT